LLSLLSLTYLSAAIYKLENFHLLAVPPNFIEYIGSALAT